MSLDSFVTFEKQDSSLLDVRLSYTAAHYIVLNFAEWGIEVHLKDHSCTPNEFLEVKLYAHKLEHLPDLDYRNVGGDTAILFSNIKVGCFLL